MQRQSQIQHAIEAAKSMKASIQARNIAWFFNQHSIEKHEECMEPFDDIECMTLERFNNNFIWSKGDVQFRIVVLGLWIVDIKRRLKFMPDDPDDTKKQHLVIRGQSHHRKRPGHPKYSRYTVGSGYDPLSKISIPSCLHLGHHWFKIHRTGPSLNQIGKGVVAEAKRQIKLVMRNMDK